MDRRDVEQLPVLQDTIALQAAAQGYVAEYRGVQVDSNGTPSQVLALVPRSRKERVLRPSIEIRPGVRSLGIVAARRRPVRRAGRTPIPRTTAAHRPPVRPRERGNHGPPARPRPSAEGDDAESVADRRAADELRRQRARRRQPKQDRTACSKCARSFDDPETRGRSRSKPSNCIACASNARQDRRVRARTHRANLAVAA